MLLQTNDHKPNKPEERARIEKAGGFVRGGRINGIFAVGRGFGDFYLDPYLGLQGAKTKLSCATPDIYTYKNVPEGAILLLACDGVWDGVVDAKGARVIDEGLQARLVGKELAHALAHGKTPQEAAELFVSYGERAYDNVTASVHVIA